MKHSEALKKLKIAKGQIESAIRMIEEERYCIDISKQILATVSLLKKANSTVLKKHIETCVKEAMETGNVAKKTEELEAIMDYLEKSL
ncbi:MAG: metal-sensing transcriptional repressor [Thermotogaceae bacterium]|nr:metal-sensing transcriptional repressor [Thermotogaceae bacterium]